MEPLLIGVLQNDINILSDQYEGRKYFIKNALMPKNTYNPQKYENIFISY